MEAIAPCQSTLGLYINAIVNFVLLGGTRPLCFRWRYFAKHAFRHCLVHVSTAFSCELGLLSTFQLLCLFMQNLTYIVLLYLKDKLKIAIVVDKPILGHFMLEIEFAFIAKRPCAALIHHIGDLPVH